MPFSIPPISPIAIGPYETMLNSVQIPAGSVGSLFQLPHAAEAATHEATTTALSGLFPTGTGSPMASMASLGGSVSSYATDKMANLHVELPMCMAAASAQLKVKQLDALITNDPAAVAAASTSSITAAFPKTSQPCTALAGQFSALTSGTKTALSGATNAASSSLSGLTPTSMSSIASLLPPGTPTPTDGPSLIASLKTLGAGALASVQAGIALLPSVTAELTTIGSSITSSVSGLASDFTAAVGAEAASVKAAIGTLTGMHFLSMLQSTDPCVSAVTAATVNPAAVNVPALSVATNPAMYNVTTSTAIAAAQTNTSLDAKEKAKTPNPNPQIVASDKYSQSEIDTMKLYVNATYNDPLAALKAAAAVEFKAGEDWKVAHNFVALRDAAGSKDSYGDGDPTKPPADLAAWIAIRDQFAPLRDHYNNVTLAPGKAFNAVVITAVKEYNARLSWGKHVYTNMEAAGYVIPAANKTSLADTDPTHV